VSGRTARASATLTRPSGALLRDPAADAVADAAPRPARADGVPLRVLFVQDHLGQSADSIHGVTRYLLSTLPALDRRAIEPSLCVLTPWHPVGGPLLEAEGIEPVFLGRAKWDPRVALDLIRLVRAGAIDVLHVSGFKAAMLGRIAALAAGRAAIVHLHDARPMAPWVRLIQRRLAHGTDAAIVVSEALRGVAVADYGMPPGRVQVLYNGVDCDAFARVPADARFRVRQELGLADDARVIGMVGRIEAGKGLKPLLEAMPAVRARCPRAVLLVVGDGPTRPDGERLVQQLGIGAAVRFTGFRRDIPELLAAMDVMAAPAIAEEGLGYAVLEAMSAALPVVATRCGGLAETVVHGETGLLVAKGNVPELADALVTILTDEAGRGSFAAAARRRSAAFSVAGHVDQLQALYRHVAQARQGKLAVASSSDGPRHAQRAGDRGARA
jgi:glycosyltransferase involved in cell wall biosynthesis